MASRHGTVDSLGDAGLVAKDKGFPKSNRGPTLDVWGCEEENQRTPRVPQNSRLSYFPSTARLLAAGPAANRPLALGDGGRGPAGTPQHPTVPKEPGGGAGRPRRGPGGGAERPARCSRSPVAMGTAGNGREGDGGGRRGRARCSPRCLPRVGVRGGCA